MSCALKEMPRLEAYACEARIQTHLTQAGNHLHEAALELARLRDERGWVHFTDDAHKHYANWDDFLERRFALSRRQFHRKLEAARVLQQMGMCQIVTKGVPESHLRELAKIPEAAREEVLREAARDNPRVTAQDLRATWEALSPEARRRLAEEQEERVVRSARQQQSARQSERLDQEIQSLLLRLESAVERRELGPAARNKALSHLAALSKILGAA